MFYVNRKLYCLCFVSIALSSLDKTTKIFGDAVFIAIFVAYKNQMQALFYENFSCKLLAINDRVPTLYWFSRP